MSTEDKKTGRPSDARPQDDSPKRQGDKLPSARGSGTPDDIAATQDTAGDSRHDSPKRQGDKLEHARDLAAGRSNK